MSPAWFLTLLLPTFLCLEEECGTRGNGFWTWQPCHLSRQVTGSVTLPCIFNYTWTMDPGTDIRVFWRLGEFHSQTFLFKHTWQNPYIHPNFTSRISLVGDLSNSHNASIQIRNLVESDSNIYFCRIFIQTNGKWETWQSILGTNLTITAGAPEQSPSVLGPVVGAVLAVLVVLLGLLLFFTWRKGCCQEGLKARRAGGRGKESPTWAEPEQDRFSGAEASNPGSPQRPSRPLKAPGEPLLYATLNLSGADKEEEAIQRPPQSQPFGQETVYAVLRH